MRQRGIRRLPLTLVLATALACAAGEDGQQSGTIPPPPAAPAPDPTVAVFLTEYVIDMPSVIEGGEVRITVTNQGVEDHNLRITRDGGEIVWETDGNVGTGLTQEAIVDLEPGEYMVVCDFAGHDSRGMFMELEVRGGGS